MKFKISFIFFHTLLVLSSTSKVKEDLDYRNSEQSLRKQKSLKMRSELLNGDSHSAPEGLSKLQQTASLLEGSIGQINKQVTQNPNRYKELAEVFQEQQQLLRTVSDSIALSHGEFPKSGKGVTQLETVRPNATDTATPESTPHSASTIHCGGKLVGESGVISYKENEMYNNDETCTWIIEVPESLKIGFMMEKSGLHICCDFVNVTSLDTAGLVQQASVTLRLFDTVFFDGPKAMVRFHSDYYNHMGPGFRLSYYKIRDLNSSTEVTGIPVSPSTSTSRCGGRLFGESGVISYKEFEGYDNRESCTWIIEVPEALKIGFKLEKSGLQSCCDGVNVTSLDTAGLVQHTPIKLKYYHTVFVDGPKAIVRFYSDDVSSRIGFRLIYYKLTDLNSINEEIINKSECGGVIVRETGAISYKFEEPYLENERCVWLVQSPNSTSITFHLRQSGFQGCCDFLSVTTIDPETGTLRNDTRQLKLFDEPVQTIQESIAAIMFSSDNSVRGDGFLLTFSGSGANMNPKYVYKLRHLTEPNGTIEYPGSDRNDDEISKQQHIYVTAKSAILDTESSQKFLGGIDMNASVFLRANDSSCVYDSLTFYEPIRQSKDKHRRGISRPSPAWQKKAQIPNENDTLLCPERFSVLKQEGFLDFKVDSFLAIYKPISKDTFESNAVVSFDYYSKPYICVEILQPLEDEFGIISYKENENYNNLENCSWIIEVTNATQIDFKLEQNGFEECCDYVEVTSLDSTGQTQGLTLPLRTGSPTASLTGWRARVNFISDELIVGSGFRLRYGRGKIMPENICGGVLNPMLNDFGVISYKATIANYGENEKCQWIIEAPGWGRIGFTREQSGGDIVTVGSASANGTEIGERVRLE
ncbi:unnamed protein product [Orchesella dallaii]|uniref:CUB domain-containing protein n=1 Tax=Orchesella dallaii TaxID=48710 RepID=A0ABP1RH68_9HEXA